MTAQLAMPLANARLTDVEEIVLEIIQNSGGCWIGAREVVRLFRDRTENERPMRERKVRYIVKALIAKGEPIVSRAGYGGGFRYVTDPEEIELCRLRWLREAKSLLWKASRFDRTGLAARLAGQLDLAVPDQKPTTKNQRPAVQP